MMQQGTANHLDGLLRVIRKMLRTDETHVQPLIDDVIRRSIERSPQRIHHYGGRLTHLIESMVQGNGTGMGESLATDLKKLVMLRDVHHEFCAASYNFRHSPSFAVLNQRIQRSNDDVFPRIRHFVGRLGYWHKTGTSLVRNARSFAPALSNARVEFIPWPVPEHQRRLALDGRLERLALRVFPNYRETSLCDELVSRMCQAQSLLMWFRTAKLVPRPHAEVVALHFLASRNIELINDDRYIGCSKPACFCCSLYMRLHPAGVQPRPTHGNVWVQWCLPRPLAMVESHSMELENLKHMTDESRSISQAALTNGLAPPRRKFDSITGFTTTGMAS
ncbi:hypothetical protein LTR81_024187 [Elasticomyces elasticus]